MPLFVTLYLVVVGIMPAGNQHTELSEGNRPDVIRLYLLSVQDNGLPPPCEKLPKFLLRVKHSLIYHLPIKILFSINFYVLQVAFGRKAHIGIAPSSFRPLYGSIIIRKQCHGARFPHLVYSKTFIALTLFIKGCHGVFLHSSAVSYVLQDCPYSVVSLPMYF